MHHTEVYKRALALGEKCGLSARARKDFTGRMCTYGATALATRCVAALLPLPCLRHPSQEVGIAF